jgi:hypothetical protein
MRELEMENGRVTDAEGTAPRAPEELDDGTLRLYGVGPNCPTCGGPTHAVTGNKDAEQPWWCRDCNLRVARDGTARGDDGS